MVRRCREVALAFSPCLTCGRYHRAEKLSGRHDGVGDGSGSGGAQANRFVSSKQSDPSALLGTLIRASAPRAP